MLLAAFQPGSKETAIFFLVGVIFFGLAAFAAAGAGSRATVGGLGLIGLGLGFTFFPQMWVAMRAAF